MQLTLFDLVSDAMAGYRDCWEHQQPMAHCAFRAHHPASNGGHDCSRCPICEPDGWPRPGSRWASSPEAPTYHENPSGRGSHDH